MTFSHSRAQRMLRAATSSKLVEPLEPRYLMASIVWGNFAGQTNFNSTASWVGGVAPGSGDIAVFPSAATIVNPVMTGNASVAGIQIDNSGADYGLSGAFTLTVGASGLSVSSPTSTTASTTSITSTLLANVANTITATNNTGITTLNLSAVNTNGVRIAAAGSGDININGVVSGTGGFDANGTGNLKLSGSNTFTGGINLNSGTLLATTSSAALGTSGVNVGATTGTASATLASTVSLSNAITVRSGSTGSATLDARNTSATITWSGAVTLQKSVTIQKGSATGTGAATFSGSISGTGNVTLQNLATGGTLALTGASINPTGSIINSGSGAGSTQISGVLGSSVTGLTQNSATSSLDVRNNNPTFSGTVTLNGGTLSITPLATGYTAQLGTGTILLGNTSGSSAATLTLGNSAMGGDLSNPITVRSGSSGIKSIRYSSTSGSGNVRGLVTLQTHVTFSKASGGGALSIRGGTAGTGNVTFDSQGTNSISVLTNPLNHAGTIINSGAGAATVLSSGIGANVTGITQNSSSSSVTINIISTALSGNFAVVSNGDSPVTFASAISSATAGTKTITHTGTGLGSLTISGVMSNGSGSVALVQNSATAPTVLTATNTTTGGATVTAGVLQVSGTLPGAISVGAAGTLSPGAVGATGTFNSGNLSFSQNGTFLGQINSNIAGSGYDTVNVTGTVNLGAVTLGLSGTRTTTTGQTITLVSNDGTDAVSGWFYNLPEGAVIASNGVAYKISYVGGTGNDVVLTDIGLWGALTNPSPWGVAPSNTSINVVRNSTTRATDFDNWGPVMSTNGIKWVRTVVAPSSSAPNTFNWTDWDHLLDVAVANDLYIVATFCFPPSYMQTESGFPATTTQLDQWQEHVTNIVSHTIARVGNRVMQWECWNEPPNFTTNGTTNTTEGTYQEYAATLERTYLGVKAADLNAQVGIAVRSTNFNWIRNVLTFGGAGNYDFLTIHPYEQFEVLTSGIGHEPMFMSIVPTARKMLQDVDPTKADVPIFITEVGMSRNDTVGGSVVDDAMQSEQLTKVMTMALAQGVSRAHWFEPLDSEARHYGLLNSNWSLKQSGQTYARLVDMLGEMPRYLGWTQLGGSNYGFVFEGAATTVMVAWNPPNVNSNFTFANSVTATNAITGAVTTGATQALSDTPLLITGIPAAMITAAKANANQPLPWGGDYSGASSVSLTVGSPNTDNGLHQVFPDSDTTVVPAYGSTARYAGAGSAVQAETLTTGGGAVIEAISSNYTGTGYVKLENATGAFVEWTTINRSTSAATQTFRLRYSNGSGADRQMVLTRNGTVLGNVTFKNTGSWNTWGHADVVVSLPAGAANAQYTIRLATSAGTGNGPYIDYRARPSFQARFTIDPNFLSYTPTSITITAEVRRDEANTAGQGFNIYYESTQPGSGQTNPSQSGWQAVGWFGADTNTSWQTKTTTLATNRFVGIWGTSFHFFSDNSSNSRYYFRNVTVTINGVPFAAMAVDAGADAIDEPIVERKADQKYAKRFASSTKIEQWTSIFASSDEDDDRRISKLLKSADPIEN